MYDKQLILSLVKARLNRLASDTSLDQILLAVIGGAADFLEQMGIHLDGSQGDNWLLVCQAVHMYQSRDQAGGDPEWLRLMRRERWLQERGEAH